MVLFYMGNIFIDSLGVRLNLWLHPEYTAGSAPFLDYLKTSPLSFNMPRIIWYGLFLFLLYKFGLRFFGSYRNISKQTLLRWFGISIVLAALLQVLGLIVIHMNRDVSANQAALERVISHMTLPKVFCFCSDAGFYGGSRFAKHCPTLYF